MEQYGLKQALYLDVDVDLYTSTLQLLTWAFEFGIANVGTLIGYDDWWADVCYFKPKGVTNSMDSGEGRAHREIAEKFKVFVNITKFKIKLSC